MCMKTPKLTRIPLDGTDLNNNIETHESYLCKIWGHWYAGRFSKQWYGWNFDNWGTSGVQLQRVEEVYLIKVEP
jgi:hypothetical protein